MSFVFQKLAKAFKPMKSVFPKLGHEVKSAFHSFPEKLTLTDKNLHAINDFFSWDAKAPRQDPQQADSSVYYGFAHTAPDNAAGSTTALGIIGVASTAQS